MPANFQIIAYKIRVYTEKINYHNLIYFLPLISKTSQAQMSCEVFYLAFVRFNASQNN